MLNILGKRYWFFGLSALVILPGLIILLIYGLPLSIDFTGGSLLEIKVKSGELPKPAEVIKLYDEFGITDAQVQTTGEGTLIIRSTFLDDANRAKVVTAMASRFSQEVEILRFDSVGPTIGQEVTSRAAMAVAVAVFIVVLYVWFAFRGIPNAFRYGVCGIASLLHSVAVIFSFTAIGGHFWGWEVDAMLFMALLTVVGFSMQDTIVVFDRIRENSSIYRRLPYETLVNHSIVQTLQRSINTQLMTSEFMLLAMAMFGGLTLRDFSVLLLVGLFSGTYASIFIAAPILVVWEKHEWRRWFKRSIQAAA